LPSGDASRWLDVPDVVAVYHTSLSPLLRAATQLGSCCTVHRGTPRRSAHEGFQLHELKAAATLAPQYLQPPATAGPSPILGASCKHLAVYMAGSGPRGVAAFVADWQQSALILIIRPRGSGVAEAARQALASHPLSAHFTIKMDAVDTWDAAYGRLQRLLPSYQAAANGPLITLAQTPRSSAELLSLAPALKQQPLVLVPPHGTDGDWGSTRLLGAGWQSQAVSRALDRYTELGPWWAEKLALARYANLPLGLLARPKPAEYAADILFQRRLLAAGHLSWANETAAAPHLGGTPEDTILDADELTNPEVEVPGMYRSMCARRPSVLLSHALNHRKRSPVPTLRREFCFG
jgi:DNA polymerase epsilon subunit 1